MCTPHVRSGELGTISLRVHYLHKLFKIFLHGRFVSYPLFIYLFKNLYLHGVRIQQYFILFIKLSQLWPLGAFSFDCCVPLTFSHHCACMHTCGMCVCVKVTFSYFLALQDALDSEFQSQPFLQGTLVPFIRNLSSGHQVCLLFLGYLCCQKLSAEKARKYM